MIANIRLATLIAATAASTLLATTVTAQGTTDAKLRAEAKISEATARATALKEVPRGVVKSSELEREGGKLIYSFDIKVPGKRGIEEVTVDAVTGALVTHEHETPAMERKEAAKERKEAAAAKKHN